MWYEISFFGNPFSSRQYIPARKLLYADDQVARLTALDAVGFAQPIAATRAAAGKLSAAASTAGAATGTQRGATNNVDSLLKACRVVIGSRYNVLLGQFNNDRSAPLLRTVFGSSIQHYTRDLSKTNAPKRLGELKKLLETNATAVGAGIVQDITGAADAYLTQRTAQTQNLADTSTAHLAESTEEAALDQVLWLNLGAVVQRYPATNQQRERHAAANFALLERRPASTAAPTETGTLAPGTTFNLVDSGLAPATPLRLHNTGAVPLRFALSPDLGTFPATGYQEVLPGATLALTAADLGTPLTQPCLNVYNPAAAEGQYEVRVG